MPTPTLCQHFAHPNLLHSHPPLHRQNHLREQRERISELATMRQQKTQAEAAAEDERLRKEQQLRSRSRQHHQAANHCSPLTSAVDYPCALHPHLAHPFPHSFFFISPIRTIAFTPPPPLAPP